LLARRQSRKDDKAEGVSAHTEYQLALGATVSVTKEAVVATDGGIWRLIDSGQSGAGWVNQAFLDIARTHAETLVDAFVEFAHDPTNSTFAVLPLVDHSGPRPRPHDHQDRQGC